MNNAQHLLFSGGENEYCSILHTIIVFTESSTLHTNCIDRMEHGKHLTTYRTHLFWVPQTRIQTAPTSLKRQMIEVTSFSLKQCRLKVTMMNAKTATATIAVATDAIG